MASSVEAHLRRTLTDTEAQLERVWEFVKDRDDDISMGVRRAIKPITVCSECGETFDPANMAYCSCWSDVTEADLDQLSTLGVEIQEPDDDL